MKATLRILISLFLASILAIPFGAAADNTTEGEETTTADTCEDHWKPEARSTDERFWSDLKSRWQAYIQAKDDEVHAFYQREQVPQHEEQAFWSAWNDDLHWTWSAYQTEIGDHHERMQRGYQDHCGDGTLYTPQHHELPMPSQLALYKEKQRQWGDDPDTARPTPHPHPAHDDGQHWEYSEECRAYDEERRQAAERLHEEFRLRWEKLEEERRAFYESGPHSPEEERAFHDKIQERERQLRADEEAAFRDLEARYADKDDCAPPAMTYDGHTVDEKCDWRYMERAFREFDDHLRQEDEEFFRLQEEKWRNHEARMEAKWRDFESQGEHTEEEWRAFDAEREKERRAFEERMQQEAQAFMEKQDAQRESFRIEQEGRCMPQGHDPQRSGPTGHPGPGPHDPPMPSTGYGPHHFDAAYEEMEIERLECQLDVQMRVTEMMRKMDEKARQYESSGTYPTEADMHEMETEMLRMELEIRKAMLACEKKIREKWDQQIRTELEDARPHERMGSWSMSEDHETGTVHLRGKYVTIQGDAMSSTLKEVSVQGQVWLSGIATDSYFADEGWNMGEGGKGSWLTGSGPGVHMRLHDDPSGLIRFTAEDGYSFLLTMPDHIEVEAVENGFSLTNGEDKALLRAHHDGASWDATTQILTVSGQAEFLVPDAAENFVLKKVANKHRGAITDAVTERKLGAEITFTSDDEGDILDETLVYEDVEVTIEKPKEKGKVEVIVGSDTLTEGKTFVLNLDERLLDVKGEIQVGYYDIDETTGAETEVAITKASGLADILDATDDEGPEYWIVMDEDGIQVLASVPNWSVHKIVVQSLEKAAMDALLPAPGLGLVLLSVVAALGTVVLRRRP